MRTKYFKHEEVFNRFELEVESEDGVRYYKTPMGDKYRSVTTILSELTKKDIQKWRERVGEETATKISTQASRRGTKLHSIVERYINNEDNFLAEEAPVYGDMFNSIKSILDDNVGVVYGQEFCLYSDYLKTAGRCDLFCTFKGFNTVVDIKTSSKPKRAEWIGNYFMQATAYAMMIGERFNINVPKIAIVMAVENGEPLLFVENTRDWINKTAKVFRQ